MGLFLRMKNIVITIMNVIQLMTSQLSKLVQMDWRLQVKVVVWPQTAIIHTESLVQMERELWGVSIECLVIVNQYKTRLWYLKHIEG